MTLIRLQRTFLVACLGLLITPLATAQTISVAPTKASYAAGEQIEWRVKVKGEKKVESLNYTIRKGGLTPMGEGKVELKDGEGTVSTKLDEPGSLLIELKLPDAKAGDAKAPRGLGGAIVEPERIQPSAPKPEDFDEFWKTKIAALQAIPANPKLEAIDAVPSKKGRPPVEYFKITMDNINGSRIYGQLAKPQKQGKYPALLLVQYAGVYALPPLNVIRRGEEGWLCLNIMAHDLPLDQPEDFYKKQSEGPLKDYVRIGNESRDTSYFLRMYLSCYRAAEYLATHPDWNGKTLVVMGTSQGGAQAFVTAGLHPKVTAMMANVPAGCDVTGKDVGRATGWPRWESNAWGGRDVKKVMATARYFDAVNFARNITCPVLVSAGLIDESCPPAGIAAALNVTKGKKELVILPLSDHKGTGGTQGAFYTKSEKWLNELKK